MKYAFKILKGELELLDRFIENNKIILETKSGIARLFAEEDIKTVETQKKEVTEALNSLEEINIKE